jgi:hypothetical protein
MSPMANNRLAFAWSARKPLVSLPKAEKAGVDQRLLHHAKRQAAGIGEAVAQRDRHHDAEALTSVERTDGFGG